ncbi:ABC transporter ATP-binding protein [Chitinophaga cymbidii]|uniref:Bacitracin ABC transporter ATP-binding protein n=1 Tax=Chitinophaga cymbidii TaxID=1096750 RepID=A0A512RP53_9BACT|nr:ABC transporter ATP-binding protein [Chitinophaga cymbidii]GEP97464.1 bacitracin ABC transporter ATP-binding protein [Chitinophaga cymbidii]
MNGNTIIQATALTRSYERKVALDKIDLNITKGDCVGIVGRNGAGKTTLLKIILGLLQQTEGTMLYEGRPGPDTDFKKRTGFYIGREYLPEELTGLQYLQFLNHLYNNGKLRAEAELLGLIGYFFEGTDSSGKAIGAYSFGMMQKIGVCGALVNQPEFLVLDEPFSGLDAFGCQRLIGFLQQYRQGRTVLLSSHDLSFVEKSCNKLLVLEQGKILYYNTMEDFTRNGRHSLEESLFSLLRPQETDGEKINWLI